MSNDDYKSDPSAPANGAEIAEPLAVEPVHVRPRGFAAMDQAKVRAAARKGGRAAHASGSAHKFSSDEAKIAGRKGGSAPRNHRVVVPQTSPAGEVDRERS